MGDEKALTTTKPKNQLEAWFLQRKAETMEVLPGDSEQTKLALFRGLQDFCRNRPAILEGCSDANVFEEVLKAARLGLTVNDSLHHASLIPFQTKNGKRAQLIVEYRGLVRLMRNSGLVKAVHTGTIHDRDKYEWTESDFRMTRTVGDRGNLVGVYCKLELADGSTQSEVMTVAEVEHVRAKSRAKDKGPWVTDWNQMARKTVLRRAANLVDWSPDDARRLGIADRTEFRFDDTATVEIKGPVPKPNRGVDALIETLDPDPEPAPETPEPRREAPPEIDPETGEVLFQEEEAPAEPPAGKPSEAERLHLVEAQRLCKAHNLPAWRTLSGARKKLIKERMKDLEIRSGREFWDRVSGVLANLTPDYSKSWSTDLTLDIVLRVPKRGNTDHFTTLDELARSEQGEPASSALASLMGEGDE